MDAKSILLAAMAMAAAAALCFPLAAFANTTQSGPGAEEIATEIGYRYNAFSLAYRLLPVIAAGAAIAGFIIWKQKYKKGIS